METSSKKTSSIMGAFNSVYKSVVGTKKTPKTVSEERSTDNESERSDTISLTGDLGEAESEKTLHNRTRIQIHKVIKALAENPNSFTNILNALERGSGYLNAFLSLEGARYELTMLGSYFQNEIVSGFLRNGLLEELQSIEDEKSTTIFKTIFSHNLTKKQLSDLGLDAISLEEHEEIANSFMHFIKTCDQSILKTLGNSLADFVETNQKIIDLEKKSDPKKDSQLAELNKQQKDNTNKIKELLLSTLKKQEPKDAALALITSITRIFANAIDKHTIDKEKISIFPSLAECDKKISDLQKGVKTAKTLEDRISIKAKIANLEAGRKAITTSAHITSFDEITFNLKNALKLKPNGSLKQLSDIITPIIATTLKYPDELAEIDKVLAEGKGITADLIISGIKLLQHPDILSKLVTKKTFDADNNIESSPPTVLARLALDFLKPEGMLDATIDGVKTIAPMALDLPYIKQTLGISEEDKEAEKQISQYKEILPDVISYVEEIIRGILNRRQELTNIETAIQNTQENNLIKFLEIARNGISLINDKEILDTIADKEKLKKFASIRFTPKSKDNTDEHKKEVETQQQVLAAIDIACDNKEYFINVANVALNDPMIEAIIPIYQAFQTANQEAKAMHLIALTNSVTALVNNEALEAAILAPKALGKIIDEAKQYEVFVKMFNSFKDMDTLKQALKDASPYLLSIAKAGAKLEGVEDLMLKAVGLAHAKELTDEQINDFTAEAIDTYAKDDKAYQVINAGLKNDKKNIAKTIDLSLSSIKKDSTELKILKPLGINGAFIVEMLQRVNNPEGLEAIKAFIKDQSISNAWNIIATTQSRSFVLSHITKSAIEYAFSKKNKDRTKLSIKVEDTKKITSQHLPLSSSAEITRGI